MLEVDASSARVNRYLLQAASLFTPVLGSTGFIEVYASKLAQHAENLFWVVDGRDLAYAGVYCNDLVTRTAFVSSFSVLAEGWGSGISHQLMAEIVNICREKQMTTLGLKTHPDNQKAIDFYTRFGFTRQDQTANEVTFLLAVSQSTGAQ